MERSSSPIHRAVQGAVARHGDVHGERRNTGFGVTDVDVKHDAQRGFAVEQAVEHDASDCEGGHFPIPVAALDTATGARLAGPSNRAGGTSAGGRC